MRSQLCYSQGITFRPFDIKDIVFGFLDTPTCDSDCMLLNYIILESKYLIYRTKLISRINLQMA